MSSLSERNVVRKFVDIVGMVGKVRFKLETSFFNAFAKTFKELPFFKMASQMVLGRVPKISTHFFINSFVSQDCKFAVFVCEIK